MAIAPSQLAAFMDAHANLMKALADDARKIGENERIVAESAAALSQLAREIAEARHPEIARRLNSIAVDLHRLAYSVRFSPDPGRT